MSGGPLLNGTGVANPCRQAYIDHCAATPACRAWRPDRESWDPATTLVAVRGEQSFYTRTFGRISVTPDGNNDWENGSAEQSYLVQRSAPEAVADALNELLLMPVPQPAAPVAATRPPPSSNCSSAVGCAPDPPPRGNCTPYCDTMAGDTHGVPSGWSPTKPNVLLLGDSIAATGTGYLDDVRAALQPAVVVENPRMYPQGGGYCGTSFGVVACLELFTGPQQQPWDVIHFVSAARSLEVSLL